MWARLKMSPLTLRVIQVAVNGRRLIMITSFDQKREADGFVEIERDNFAFDIDDNVGSWV